MGFVQNSKIRTTGRVRVTKRLVSKPDHRGRQTILAREGEELSAAEAYRRGIRAKDVEGIGPSGKIAVDALRDAHKADDADEVFADAFVDAQNAERASGQAADAARAARVRGELDTFPVDRGGGMWALSDGSTFTGTEADARAAQAELTPAVNPATAGDEVPDGNMDEVKGWVGDDQARAAAALEVEQAKGDKARPTLIEYLEKVAAGDGS